MSELERKIKRLEQIKNKVAIIITEKNTLQAEHHKILLTTRKLRIKKIKMGYQIICTGPRCGNKYKTTKNPDAYLKDARPQCIKCGTRVETKR